MHESARAAVTVHRPGSVDMYFQFWRLEVWVLDASGIGFWGGLCLWLAGGTFSLCTRVEGAAVVSLPLIRTFLRGSELSPDTVMWALAPTEWWVLGVLAGMCIVFSFGHCDRCGVASHCAL